MKKRLITVAAFITMLSAASAQLMISDFNGTGLDYVYSGAVQTLNGTYLNLTSTPSNGGGGSNFLMDLSAYSGSNLQLTARTGFTNTSQIQIQLTDSDGTQAIYQFSSSLFNTSTFTTVESNNAISTPDTTFNAGTTAGLNLAAIVDYQIYSDFSGSGAFDYDIDQLSVAAVPEPSGAALIVVGLASLAALRFARSRQCSK